MSVVDRTQEDPSSGVAPKGRDYERFIAAGARALVVLGALAAWQLAGAVGLVSTLYVSSPVAVFKAIFTIFGEPGVLESVLLSLGEIGVAFLLASLIGLALGLGIGLSREMKRAFGPLALFIMATPKIIFLPFFILTFGITSTTRSTFGAFEAIPYVVVSVMAGLELVQDKHRMLASSLNAPRWKFFRTILLPASMPGIITAIWYALRYAFAGVLMAGLFVANDGIGYLVRSYTLNLHTDKLLALVIVVSVVVILAAAGWSRIERAMTKWRNVGVGAGGNP